MSLQLLMHTSGIFPVFFSIPTEPCAVIREEINFHIEACIVTVTFMLGYLFPFSSGTVHVGQMRKQYPGVALSVKTHQATRSVLNHCRDTIKSLIGSGMLDENEAEKLFMVRNVRG